MSSTVQDIVIVGAGGHGRVVLDMCRAAKHNIAGFIDSQNPAGTHIDGIPVLGDNALLSDKAFIESHRFLVAIGNQPARLELAAHISTLGGKFATIVHPSCVLSPNCAIGEGTVVVAGAVINTGAHIGQHCIINTGATIDHDVVLEDGVQISPGVHLAGNVHCEKSVFIGVGASVIPKIRVGQNAIIGAGAVVIRNVAANITVAGNPAQVIEHR